MFLPTLTGYVCIHLLWDIKSMLLSYLLRAVEDEHLSWSVFLVTRQTQRSVVFHTPPDFAWMKETAAFQQHVAAHLLNWVLNWDYCRLEVCKHAKWFSVSNHDTFCLAFCIGYYLLGVLCSMAASPEKVLLIDYQWCERIFRCGKTWELRNKSCNIRGRIGIACTAKSSPTGTCLLLGEVFVVDCIKVAENRSGFVAPPLCDPENYMFLARHMEKHQVSSLEAFPVLASYLQVFAWVLERPFEYEKPQEFKPKGGCVVWAKNPTSQNAW